jgi:hypothetical protein
MRNIGFVLILLLTCILNVEAKYVRQLKEPDFFIPDKDKMHQQEKLPQIHFEKKVEAEKTVKKAASFKEIPEYKTKYEKYLADMRVLAKTKQMPENSELEQDLQAMNMEEAFEVTSAPVTKITSKEQNEFYLLAKEILAD